MVTSRKRKPYHSVKEVKRRARILQGQPPPARTQPDKRKNPPKHRGKEAIESWE